MARAGRRHYRVAQKEIEASKNECCSGGCDCKKKLIIIVSAVVAITFIKGLFFGYLIGKKS